MSTSYYDQNASEFFNTTVSVDVSPLYEKFIPNLPTNANVIDAGCGSGRDTCFFLSKGFNVTSFDASHQLSTLANCHTQHPIMCCTFLEFSTKLDSQDGIWACASLLHVPKSELRDTVAHLANFLKTGGTFYCSFKYGDNEVERNGRRFTNLNERLLESLIESLPLEIKETWVTQDLRPGRESEKWLNALLTKNNS